MSESINQSVIDKNSSSDWTIYKIQQILENMKISGDLLNSNRQLDISGCSYLFGSLEKSPKIRKYVRKELSNSWLLNHDYKPSHHCLLCNGVLSETQCCSNVLASFRPDLALPGFFLLHRIKAELKVPILGHCKPSKKRHSGAVRRSRQRLIGSMEYSKFILFSNSYCIWKMLKPVFGSKKKELEKI